MTECIVYILTRALKSKLYAASVVFLDISSRNKVSNVTLGSQFSSQLRFSNNVNMYTNERLQWYQN